MEIAGQVAFMVLLRKAEVACSALLKRRQLPEEGEDFSSATALSCSSESPKCVG
jgi:hypothetical protein